MTYDDLFIIFVVAFIATIVAIGYFFGFKWAVLVLGAIFVLANS